MAGHGETAPASPTPSKASMKLGREWAASLGLQNAVRRPKLGGGTTCRTPKSQDDTICKPLGCFRRAKFYATHAILIGLTFPSNNYHI